MSDEVSSVKTTYLTVAFCISVNIKVTYSDVFEVSAPLISCLSRILWAYNLSRSCQSFLSPFCFTKFQMQRARELFSLLMQSSVTNGEFFF